jgi:hemolysin activation/secretion protein
MKLLPLILALCCGCAAIVVPQALRAQQSPAAAIAAPRFEIRSFEVSGDSILGRGTVERILQPFTGQGRDFGHVQRALDALEAAYRARGFGVVQVRLPEQDISLGVVRFEIIEPRLGRVHIEGNRHFGAANLRRALPSLQEGAIPNSGAIARDLQIVNEHPVRQTAVVLRAGAGEGALDASVRVSDDRPWRWIATLDDSGNGDTGYMRLGLGFQHSNLFDRDHVLTAQYVTSPAHPDQVAIYGLGYRIPYYRLHSSLELFAGYSDVDSGTVQGLFSVSGQGAILGARWHYHLPRHGNLEQRLVLGVDQRAFRNNVTLGGISLVPDITVQPVSLGYASQRRMSAAEWNFNAAVARNLPGGVDGDAAAFGRTRPGADPEFTHLRYAAGYTRALAGDWQARAALTGQYTRDLLVPGEQYGIGGPDSVRGYLLREAASDTGHALQLEAYTPDLAARLGLAGTWRARLLGFHDLGQVRRNDPLPGELAGKFLASAGFGLRLTRGRSVSLRLDLAHILRDHASRQAGDLRLNGALMLIH